MSGRIRRSFHLYGAARRVSLSLVPFLPFSLISSLQSSCNSCCHRRGWWGAKDVCGSQGAHHGGVGYQTRSRLPSAALAPPSPSPPPPLSVFLFFVSSSTVHIPSSLSSLLAASSACLIFSFFSFAVHLLRPLSFPLPLFVAAAILRHM